MHFAATRPGPARSRFAAYRSGFGPGAELQTGVWKEQSPPYDRQRLGGSIPLVSETGSPMTLRHLPKAAPVTKMRHPMTFRHVPRAADVTAFCRT